MPSTSEATSVERELFIDAKPETVWELLVDPDKASAWMGLQSWSEPNVGAAYRVEVIPGHIASGEYLEIDAPRRLVITWGWEGESSVPPGSSTIAFDLPADGEGTHLRFVHSGLPSAEAAASHAHGWDHYFERLAIAAPGGDPGPDPWLTGDMT